MSGGAQQPTRLLLQGYKMLQGYKITRIIRIIRLQGYKDYKDYKAIRLQGYKATRLQDEEYASTAWWPTRGRRIS